MSGKCSEVVNLRCSPATCREMELFGSLLKEEQAALEKGVILPGFVNQYLRSRADATTEVTSGNGTTEDR